MSHISTRCGSATTRRDAISMTLVAVAVLIVTLAPFGATSPLLAQDPGVTRRLLADALVDPAASDGAMTVTRVELAPAGRTDSLVLDGPVVIAVETGVVKVWTRAGTTLDGVPVTAPIDTIYATKQQSLSVPARVRFRIRAVGCTPAKLLFVLLAPRGEGSGR